MLIWGRLACEIELGSLTDKAYSVQSFVFDLNLKGWDNLSVFLTQAHP